MKIFNRRLAGIVACLLSAILIVSGMGGTEAGAAVTTYLTVTGTTPVIYPGKTTHVSVPVSLQDQNFYFTVSFFKATVLEGDLTVSNLTVKNKDGYKIPDYYNDISSSNGSKYTIEFDVTADEELAIGKYTVRISAYGNDWSDESDSDVTVTLADIDVAVKSELALPDLIITGATFGKDIFQGTSSTMTLTIKNAGDIASYGNTVTVSFPSGVKPDYNVSRVKISDLRAGETTRVEIPFTVQQNAETGNKEIPVVISGKTKKGTAASSEGQSVYMTILSSNQNELANKPSLSVTTENNYKDITPGANDKIVLQLANIGGLTATDIKVSSDSFGVSSGITKTYTTDSIAVEDIRAKKNKSVKIPFTVSGDITAGLHEIVIKVNYKDDKGTAYEETLTMYLKVAADKAGKDSKNNLVIKNVSQSPSSPYAGGRVTISFDIMNDGDSAISDLKVSGTGLSSSGFEPVSNDPTVSVGTIKANASKHVNITFKCGKNISEGSNPLGLVFEYTDANSQVKTVEKSLYVLNVIPAGDGTKDVGRPKLIVSEYATDEDILKAGSAFGFTFTLKNTHASKTAKNIKITVSQADGIFEPEKGTNIFYIDEIKAGEVAVQEIRLKTRSDATTGDYPLSLKVEYEYDDMSEVDKEKGGVSEENTIKLRAIENYRPVIENINMDSYAGINVGEPVDLNMEFYNMGKSTLGNVFVTIEGDFELANHSNMSYVGAVNGYSSEYITVSVVPLMSGDATGTVTVHFEDSNGDEVTLSQDFFQYVNDTSYDPGFDPGFDPGYDPGFDPGFEPVDEEDGAKKILGLPLWLFIPACGAVAGVAATIIVVIVKRRKKKAGVEEDEDY